jgi:threonylcarbamoyladenosine tRNA methylthiotransferase MtaB
MYTLGCKVNTYETNKMIQMFKEAGYDNVDFETKSDVYVINTCTVTNMSDRKSRQMFRRARELNPNAVLCVVGCYAQVAKEELIKLPEIDIVLGTNDRCNIVKHVEKFLENKNKIAEVTDITPENALKREAMKGQDVRD